MKNKTLLAAIFITGDKEGRFSMKDWLEDAEQLLRLAGENPDADIFDAIIKEGRKI